MNEDDTQVYNKHKAEELTPRLLYCEHNIKDQTGIEDLMQLRSQAHGDLLSSLDVSSIVYLFSMYLKRRGKKVNRYVDNETFEILAKHFS